MQNVERNVKCNIKYILYDMKNKKKHIQLVQRSKLFVWTQKCICLHAGVLLDAILPIINVTYNIACQREYLGK